MRPHKEYKPGDIIETTLEEQVAIAKILQFQEAFIDPYWDAKKQFSEAHPITIEAKKFAKYATAKSEEMFRLIFPGLPKNWSFAQELEWVGKLEKFIVCSQEQAFEHFAMGQIGHRILTDEWEADYQKWIKERLKVHPGNPIVGGSGLGITPAP